MNTEAAVVDQHALLEAPVTKETARPTLELLRTERIANRVTDSDFARRSDYLLRMEAGEAVQVPNLHPSMEQRLEQQVEETMRPGEPHEFRIEYPPLHKLEGEALEYDTELRQVLADARIPVRLGGPIVERIDRVIRDFAPLDAETREIKLESFRSALRKQWGDQYQKRTDAIIDLVTTATAKHERVGEVFEAAPWILADVAVAEWLWSVIEYKQARK